MKGFPRLTPTLLAHARGIVEEAFKTCDLIYGVEEAIKWGSDFYWPVDVFTRDVELARKSAFNLQLMVQQQHRTREQHRLSTQRIDTWVPHDDPDRDRLLDLVTGMRILLPSTFVPNNTPPPQRKLYLQVSNAVNKILLESWKEGLVFILPRSVATSFSQPLHYSPVHWTTKVGKKCGRNLFDSSDDKYGPCLNSDEAKVMLETYYGTIEHPTIQTICQMVTQYSNSVNPSERNNIILWKADLKGAFTLLNFRPHDVQYLACALTDDLVLLYHTGLFGWTGTPYAFQVITRVIRRLLRTHISSFIEMYVDDMIGVCLASEFEAIRRKVICICEGLLGPRAVAADKWDHGRCLDILGWNIDLDTQLVSIARRNFLKVVCGFFNPDITLTATVAELERLASWSARYTTILRHATPLTTVLYAEVKGFRNRSVSKNVSSFGRSAILIWRYLLCMLDFNYTTYRRSIISFSDLPPAYKICFDASLTGVGVGIHTVDNDKVLSVTSYPFPFSLDDESKYQNSVEFIAVVVGFWMLHRLGIRDCTVRLEGDSITALTWGTTERFKGLLNLGAVITFILLGTRFNIWVQDSVHIPGVDNVTYDALSRGTSCKELGFNDTSIVDLSMDIQFNSLIGLCNPKLTYNNENELLELWKSIWKLIGASHSI